MLDSGPARCQGEDVTFPSEEDVVVLRADTSAEMNTTLVQALRDGGRIRTERISRAFEAVPRHLFVPGAALEDAYRDDAWFAKRDADGRPVSSVSAPWLVAAMLERLNPQPGGRMLEIGSGGYNAALLRHVVGPHGTVTSVDIDPEVTDRAAHCLRDTPWEDVRLVTGDGNAGVADGAPYEGIMVTVQATAIAPAWLDQLAPNGRLVVPLRVRGLGRLITFTRTGDHLSGGGWEPCGFVRMRGQAGRNPVTTTVLGQGVRLRVDDGPQPDQAALTAALRGERHEVWTGVTVGVTEGTRPVVDVWLATVLDAYGRLHVDTTVPEYGGELCPLPGGSPATWTKDTLAYLTMRPVDGDPARFEYGIAWHGASREPADHCAEQMRVWGRHHRAGPGPVLLLYPAGFGETPPAGRVLDRPGPQMVLHWP